MMVPVNMIQRLLQALDNIHVCVQRAQLVSCVSKITLTHAMKTLNVFMDPVLMTSQGSIVIAVLGGEASSVMSLCGRNGQLGACAVLPVAAVK